MAGITLIQDFAILLLAAGIVGSLCRRLGLSVIVGYLVAGMVIGPYTPPFSLIVDEARIQAISQLGLVFLMFSIGLGLSLTKFARMGAGVVVATATGAFLVLNLTELLGFAAGWKPMQTVFIAAMLMVSSSAVIAKFIAELKLSHEPSSQRALAVTLLEDVVAVAMLTLLGSQSGSGAVGHGGLGRLLGGLSAFVVLLVSAGLLLVPRLLRRLESRADPEMQTIVVAGVLFLLSLATAKAGFSTALGAFLLGAIVAEIPQKAGVEKAFSGLRDLFSSVFFVSIGMMIDVRLLPKVWPAILLLAAFALVVRPLACGFAQVLAGVSPREARRSALLLTPLGEFSFIIAQLGVSTGVLRPAYYAVAVGVSVVTVLIAPLLARHRERILGALDRLEPAWVTRAMDAYHGWLQQLRDRPHRRPVAKLLRSRLIQISIEMLLVSGLLIYSDRLHDALAGTAFGSRFARTTFDYAYWTAVAVLTLVPLVAVWRNCTATALIVAESAEGGRLPRQLVERVVRAFLALAIGYWVYVVMPHGDLTRWGWILIAAGAAMSTAIFSRRLIYWHSEWQSTVSEVLAGKPIQDSGASPGVRTILAENLSSWNLALADCPLPDASACAGRTLAELAIPTRFGCTVAEIDRNGHRLRGIGPDTAVFSGDRLLLLGEPSRLAVARDHLTQETQPPAASEASEGAILDQCIVTGPRAGCTLAELRISQSTGVRIVGIQRGGLRIINPAGSERLERGDSLLLLGTLAKIRRFRRWLVETD